MWLSWNLLQISFGRTPFVQNQPTKCLWWGISRWKWWLEYFLTQFRHFHLRPESITRPAILLTGHKSMPGRILLDWVRGTGARPPSLLFWHLCCPPVFSPFPDSIKRKVLLCKLRPHQNAFRDSVVDKVQAAQFPRGRRHAGPADTRIAQILKLSKF